MDVVEILHLLMKKQRMNHESRARLFRQHALEYIKELVGVEAAMFIFEDISEGKQTRSIDFCKKLFDGVILNHECFRPSQKSKK